MPELADADPVALVLTFLKAHQVTAAELGGPTNVSGIHEAPWPHLIVTEGPNGVIRDSLWSQEQEVILSLVGDPTGMPGKAELRRKLLRLVAAVCALPEVEVTDPTKAVVSNVEPNGNVVYTPLTTGQPAYDATITVTVRPPLVANP